MELLTLSLALNHIDTFKSFKIEDIYKLVQRFYPQNFTKIELHTLRRLLECLEINAHSLQEFQNITSLFELCSRLVETKKAEVCFLFDRLNCLVWKFLISTATIEREFSAIKLIKTTHQKKIKNEFLPNCLVVYIEREIADNINSDVIINEFSF